MAGKTLERHAARYRDAEETLIHRPGWPEADTMVRSRAISARGRRGDASCVFRPRRFADPGRIFPGDVVDRAPEQRSRRAHAPDKPAHRPALREAGA